MWCWVARLSAPCHQIVGAREGVVRGHRAAVLIVEQDVPLEAYVRHQRAQRHQAGDPFVFGHNVAGNCWTRTV